MQSALPVLELFDPRGRCDRRGMAAMVGALTGLEAVLGVAIYGVGVDPDGAVALLVKVVLMYVGCNGASKRLHDIGRSGWWTLGGLAGVALWCALLTVAVLVSNGPQALLPGSPWLVTVSMASVAPGLALLLWLHFTPGERRPNRYGPVPQGLGFARYQSGRQGGPVQAAQPVAEQPMRIAA